MHDSSPMASSPIERQRQHPRHGPILNAAISLDAQQDAQDAWLTVVQCFEEQVAAFPDYLAVQAPGGSATYAELNRLANRYAHRLRDAGVATGDTVALIAEKSVAGIAAILAMLKIGAAYLALDLDQPPRRSASLMAKATVKAICSTRPYLADLEDYLPADILRFDLDQLSGSLNGSQDEDRNLNLVLDPNLPARLGFTSGSTGEPKLTVRTQGQIIAAALSSAANYGCSRHDRHTLMLPLSKLHLTNLFSPLLTGASAHLYPDGEMEIAALMDWVEAQQITLLIIPVVLFRELVHFMDGIRTLPSVRIIAISGQMIHRRDAELFQQKFARGAILACRYGMTEIGPVAQYMVDHDVELDTEMMPCGYPFPGIEIYIRDDHGQLLGADEVGQVGIRNVAGARQGKAADDSNASPVETIWIDDIGLVRSDGCLVLLGRKDDMIKVRGNRVALSEAESLLLKVAGVAQAVIKPFPTPSGDNRLVGYVTLAPDAQLSEADVRAVMHQLAPPYMVPARVMVVSTLPMTTTGKVDRQALPAPATTRPDLATPFVAPRNETEQQIADIWAELLELDEIGVEDNFFDLGGNSITAMRMVLKVEAATGMTTPAGYFQAPTVAALAASTPDITVTTSPVATGAVDAPLAATHTPHHAPALHARSQFSAPKLLRGLTRRLIHQRLMGMSYPDGVAWLMWLGQSAWAGRLFPRERGWLQTLAQELDTPTAASDAASDEAFRLSIMGNMLRQSFRRTWLSRPAAHDDLMAALLKAPERFWRTFAQRLEAATPEQRASRFQLSGLEHLIYAQKRQRGTILVTYHGAASALANVTLAHQTNLGHIPTVSLERAEQMAGELWDDEGEETQARAATVSAGWAATYALQAQRILQQGGIVRIVNDISYDAPNSHTKIIGQRQYSLKPGFADLAQTTGASVLPIYSTFDATGRVHLTICPALTTPTASGQSARDNAAYVDDLLDQYVAFLVATWRTAPASLGWGSLHRYTQRPRVHDGVRT